MVKYRKDDLTILDLEKLYEETSTELRQSTWPRIVARVRSQNIRAEYLGCNQNGMLCSELIQGQRLVDGGIKR